jgi:hypothetical protein
VIDEVHVLAADRPARRHACRVLLVERFGRAGAELVFADRPIGAGAGRDRPLRVQGTIAGCGRALCGRTPNEAHAGPAIIDAAAL